MRHEPKGVHLGLFCILKSRVIVVRDEEWREGKRRIAAHNRHAQLGILASAERGSDAGRRTKGRLRRACYSCTEPGGGWCCGARKAWRGERTCGELYRSSGLDGERGPDQDRAERERALRSTTTPTRDSRVMGDRHNTSHGVVLV